MSESPTRECHPSRIAWGLLLLAAILAVYWLAGAYAFDSITQLHESTTTINVLRLVFAVALTVAAAGTAVLVALFTLCIN